MMPPQGHHVYNETLWQPIRHGNKLLGLLPFLESHSLRTPSRSWGPHRRRCSLPQWNQHSLLEDRRPQSSHRQSPHSPRAFGSIVASCHNQRSGLMPGPGTRKVSKIVCQIAVKFDWWHRCQHACQISTEWLNDLWKCFPGAPFTNMD